MARYELKSVKSSKFWEVTLEGTLYTTKYGRIGTKGQSTTKTFTSAAKAKKACEQLIASKLAKGYKKVATASSKKISPKKTPTKKARAKVGTVERVFQHAVARSRKTVSADSGMKSKAQSQELLVWHLESNESGETRLCSIEVEDDTLRMKWGRKGTPVQTKEETFSTPEQAEKAGRLLAGRLLRGSYKRVKSKKPPKETRAERVCATIIREVGKKELERIGSLAEQIMDDDAGQAATELIELHSRMNCPSKEFFELIAVASGAELADMGQRGDFLMNVVTSQRPDQDDLDCLVDEATSYVDIDSFWDWMFGGVTKVLLRNKRIRKAYPDLKETDKRHYFATMEASFRHFVRPRLVKAMKSYR